jgi:monofunctional glycosyltransferase
MAKGKKRKRIFKILLWFLLIFIFITVFPVFLYKFVHPPITPLMVLRGFETDKKTDYKWIPIEKMSHNLFQAALAAEDDTFMKHHGFDFRAIKLAYESNQKSKRTKGGSTISQQTAKNVFLWPHRDFVRKGLEAWFTVLIEFVWGKERIMETYMNVVEFGPGVYGVEAASLKYFNKHAAKLSKYEAASLISVLPNPNIYKVLKPSAYTQRYRNAIVRRMDRITKVKFD